jgi:hypothetical protein
MSKPPPNAIAWLAGYLRSGEAIPEHRVFKAARHAGVDYREVRPAARSLGVEISPGRISSWWRLPRDSGPPGGSTPRPATMLALNRLALAERRARKAA